MTLEAFERNDSPEDVARKRYPWLFVEPDAYELARLIAEEAHRSLTATGLPSGYGPAPDHPLD
jgi:hypothetical protein